MQRRSVLPRTDWGKTQSSEIPRPADEVGQKRAHDMSCLKSIAACWLLVFTSLFTISTSAYGQVSLAGNPVNFGNVQLGTNLIQPLVLTNTGRASVTIYRVTVSGTGFTFVGPTLPIVVNSQKSVTLSVSFLAQTAGSVTGSAAVQGYVTWATSIELVTAGLRSAFREAATARIRDIWLCLPA